MPITRVPSCTWYCAGVLINQLGLVKDQYMR